MDFLGGLARPRPPSVFSFSLHPLIVPPAGAAGVCRWYSWRGTVMFASRAVGLAALFLIALPAGAAEMYPLSETAAAGDCVRIHLDLKLTGELRIRKGDQQVPLKLEAVAAHD